MKLGSLIAWAVGLLVLFLTARGAVWAIRQDTPAPQSILPVETVPVVPSATGTATLDYSPTLTQAAAAVAQAQGESLRVQQEAIFVQQTSEAVHIEALRITAEAEARELEGKRIDATQTANSIAVTYQVSILTATAFAPMSTLQAGVLADRAEQRAHEAGEPTREALLVRIEAERKYGGWQIFGSVVVGTAFLAFIVLVGWAVTRPIRVNSELKLPESGPIIIPFEQVSENTLRRFEPEIPCTEGQLLEFAEAVLGGASLGINRWEEAGWKRDVVLRVRAWLRASSFAEPAARAGELQMDRGGRGAAFLREVVTRKTPPPPYYCKPIDAELPVMEHDSIEYDPEGEGLEEND